MRRVPELDALRGLAALGVVLYHAYPHVFFLGWSCVDLFFVLSGFLITTAILEHVRDRGFFAAFYFRRSLRIWPIYYLTLLAVLLANAMSRQGYGTDGIIWHLFFLQNIQHYVHAATPAFPHPFSPSWSVAIEEQFYLLWPATLWLCGRGAAIPVALGLIVLSVIARVGGWPYDILIGRGDGLAFGAVLAALWRSVPASEPGRSQRMSALMKRFLAFGLAASLFASVIAITFWQNPIPQWTPIAFPVFGALWFGIVGLVLCRTGSKLLWPLRLPVLRWLGSISYAMYMFHLPIMTYSPALLERCGVHSVAAQTVIEWLAIFGLPTVSYWVMEKPLLSLKRLLPYPGELPSVPKASLAQA